MKKILILLKKHLGDSRKTFLLFSGLAIILTLSLYGRAINQAMLEEAYLDMAEQPSELPLEPDSFEGDSVDLGVDTDLDSLAEPTPEAEEIDVQATRPNEIGQIMIIMYHGVEQEATTPYQRSVEDFQQDLHDLYQDGFRLISLDDLIHNRISVPAGYAPVVLTFDDGLSTAFSLVEENGVLKPRPDCAVDILNRFCEEYPDFGKGAVFFINNRPHPFPGAGTLAERFQYLRDNGYELGNHSASHARFSLLTEEEIQRELAQTEALVAERMPDYAMNALAYPYGERPKAALREAVLEGAFEGQAYHYAWGLREGQSGASAAFNHIAFDPLNIPRVRGTNSDKTDLGWFLEYFKAYPERRYVSDGNPDRITVPVSEQDNVNPDSLGDKELYLYE